MFDKIKAIFSKSEVEVEKYCFSCDKCLKNKDVFKVTGDGWDNNYCKECSEARVELDKIFDKYFLIGESLSRQEHTEKIISEARKDIVKFDEKYTVFNHISDIKLETFDDIDCALEHMGMIYIMD